MYAQAIYVFQPVYVSHELLVIYVMNADPLLHIPCRMPLESDR